MRYQLPDGMTSISALGHAFIADSSGVITVPDTLSTTVHAALMDKTTWGLQPLGTAAEETAALTAPPTETPEPELQNKRNLLTLLRGLGYKIDGRATFEYLRKKAIGALTEMEPAAAATVAAPAATPVAAPAATVQHTAAAEPPVAKPEPSPSEAVKPASPPAEAAAKPAPEPKQEAAKPETPAETAAVKPAAEPAAKPAEEAAAAKPEEK